MVSNSAAESDSSLTGTPGQRMTNKSSGSSSVRKEQNKAASRVYSEWPFTLVTTHTVTNRTQGSGGSKDLLF